MSFFDPNIQDKLRDLESPLNQRVSFEEVMNRREKKKRRGIFFYMPRIVVFAGLFFAAGLGYYSWNLNSTKNGKESLVIQPLSVRKSANAVKKQSKITAQNQESFKSTTEESNKIELTSSNQHQQAEATKMASSDFIKKVISPALPEIESLQSPELLIAKTKVTKPEIENPVLMNDANAIEIRANVSEVSELQSPGNLIANSSQVDVNQINSEEFSIWSKGLKLVPMEPQYSVPDYIERKGEDIFAHAPKNPPQSPYFLEFSAATGSRVLLNFDPTLPLSILGSQYNAQYQLAFLKDIGGDIMLGAGASYGEWIGNGQWQKRQWKTYEVHDSVVLVDYPNQGNRQVIYVDSNITELQTTVGEISYRINKLSVPLLFRKQAMLGKVPIRFGMQLAPGRTLKTSGYYFSDFEYHTIDKVKLTTVDFKLAIGPSFAISKNYTVVIEPNFNMQAFYDQRSSKLYSKSFYGFGFSLLRRF